MRTVSERELTGLLGGLTDASPRVVASGNFATPVKALDILDATVETYRLFILNAQNPIPARPDVVHETPFVGPGMRHTPGLDYLPMRLSLVPRLFATTRPPDVVVVHTSVPRNGKVSLGIEVNILPAAIEQARRPRSPRHRPAEPAHALHDGRRGDRHRDGRPRHRSGTGAPGADAARTRRQDGTDRRAGRAPCDRRRNSADGHRPGSRCCAEPLGRS